MNRSGSTDSPGADSRRAISGVSDPTVAIVAGLVTSFVGMGVARANVTAGQVLFLAAAALAAWAGSRATTIATGPNRWALTGAAAAMAAVCIFGATEIGTVGEEEWQSLSFFVAPTCGLATVWWWGHVRYTDHLRWVPALVGAGWSFVGGLAFAIFASQAARGGDPSDIARIDAGALAAAGYGLAALLAFAAAVIVIGAAATAVRSAMKPQTA